MFLKMLTFSFAPRFNATDTRLLSKVSLISLGYILWSAKVLVLSFSAVFVW